MGMAGVAKISDIDGNWSDSGLHAVEEGGNEVFDDEKPDFQRRTLGLY
jgi:hypothetical protein